MPAPSLLQWFMGQLLGTCARMGLRVRPDVLPTIAYPQGRSSSTEATIKEALMSAQEAFGAPAQLLFALLPMKGV